MGLAAGEQTAPSISTQAPSKFTPGPWRISGYDVRAPRGFASITVAIAASNPSIFFGGEAEANARLIAAAPDMLAALQMVRELDDAYGIDFTEQQRDQLHDAIRKAGASS